MIWSNEVIKQIDSDRSSPDFTSWAMLANKYTRQLGEPISGEQLRSAWRRATGRKGGINRLVEDVSFVAAPREAHALPMRGVKPVIEDDEDIEQKPVREFRLDDMFLFNEFDPNGVLKFGALGDTHLGSKYERLDLVQDLYRVYKENGVRVVFHTGNYVEGDASFNRMDVHTTGMDAQLRYFALNYPEVPGIKTLYIGGDDHEGWWSQREGIDAGDRLEHIAGKMGRKDLVYLGYMERDVRLSPNIPNFVIRVIHPGGGSSKAISATSQAIVDSFEPDDLPTISLNGHYHKAEFLPVYKTVTVLQTGAFQEQTPFMRKKRLASHIGAWMVEVKLQDGKPFMTTATFISYKNRQWKYQ